MVTVWLGIEVLSCWFWAMPTKGLGKQNLFPSAYATPVEDWPHKNRQGVVWKLAAWRCMDRRQNAFGLEIHVYVETCFHTSKLGECHEDIWWWAHKKGSSAAYICLHVIWQIWNSNPLSHSLEPPCCHLLLRFLCLRRTDKPTMRKCWPPVSVDSFSKARAL